jgi:RNA polymerase sigma-70 factor, ECF subfamily
MADAIACAPVFVTECGTVAVRTAAVNGLNVSVALPSRSGRSAPRERARGSEPRRAWVLASARVIAAIGGGPGPAAARPAPFALPCLVAPASHPMAVSDVPATKAERRAPVDTAIVALVPLAAAGDEVAFTRLVGAFHADMARVAYFVCGGDRDATEDAVQSAWTVAWRRLGTLREPERIRAWLLSVTANEARQLLRRQRQATTIRLEFAEERMAAPDPYGSAAALDMADVLARLKPEERTLVGLRYAAGLDSAEIGAVLGMSASGVRSRLDRLLDRLRAELEHE